MIVGHLALVDWRLTKVFASHKLTFEFKFELTL